MVKIALSRKFLTLGGASGYNAHHPAGL